jgi:hypothetical protein
MVAGGEARLRGFDVVLANAGIRMMSGDASEDQASAVRSGSTEIRGDISPGGMQ